MSSSQVGRDDGGGSRGGRGGRLRIGRDAKDTDVLKRFSSKLEDALGKNDETRRDRGDDRDGHKDRDRDRGRDNSRREGGGGGRGGGGGSRYRRSGSNDREGGDPGGGLGHRRTGDDNGGGSSRRGQEARQGFGYSSRAARDGEGGVESAGRNGGGGSGGGGGDGDGTWRERQAREDTQDKNEDALDGGGGDRRPKYAGMARERAGDERGGGRGGDERGGRGEADGDRHSRHRRDGSRDRGMDYSSEGAGSTAGGRVRGDSRDRRTGTGGSRGEGDREERGGRSRTDDVGVKEDTSRTGSGSSGGRGRASTAAEVGIGRKNGSSDEHQQRPPSQRGEDRGGRNKAPDERASIKEDVGKPGAAAVDSAPTSKRPTAATAAAKAAVAEEKGAPVVTGVPAAAVAAPPAKSLTEAQLTKLAVAAMKAKLKGDKATHARLIEEVCACFLSFRLIFTSCRGVSHSYHMCCVC